MKERIPEIERLESSGLTRKEIARRLGMSPGRVSQLMPRKYVRASKKTKSCWRDMIRRCTDPRFPKYELWGGRGIKVCERWMSFEMFLEDMGESPVGLTLERIDNAKGYEPGNCRWATYTEQLNNRRSNRVLEACGQRKTLTEWARDVGITPQAMDTRLKWGWPVEKAVTTPATVKR